MCWEPLRVYAIWHDVNFSLCRLKAFHVPSNFFGDSKQPRGGAEHALGHFSRTGLINQATMPGLLFQQRRVDLKQAGRSVSSGIFHPSKTPERISFINQAEWPLLLKR